MRQTSIACWPFIAGLTKCVIARLYCSRANLQPTLCLRIDLSLRSKTSCKQPNASTACRIAGSWNVACSIERSQISEAKKPGSCVEVRERKKLKARLSLSLARPLRLGLDNRAMSDDLLKFDMSPFLWWERANVRSRLARLAFGAPPWTL